MGDWDLTQAKDLLSLAAGLLTIVSVVVAAVSARGRLTKRQAALSELLDRQDLSDAARAAITERRDRVIAKIVAAEHVSPIHLLLVGTAVVLMLAAVGGIGYHAGGTTVASDLWAEAGGKTWTNIFYGALHVTVTSAVVDTFLHLIFERYRVQDEVLEGLVPEALKPRPVRPDVRTFLGALGLPVTVLGVSAAVASTPEAVLPQPAPILAILAGAIAMVVGLVDLFLDRVPAYFPAKLRAEPPVAEQGYWRSFLHRNAERSGAALHRGR